MSVVNLSVLTDAELQSLARDVWIEQDSRLPLDPTPWAWSRSGPRYPTGPRNDGLAYPNGKLSELHPREGFRQNLDDYAHTETWVPPYAVDVLGVDLRRKF